jgi:hypothetical protein
MSRKGRELARFTNEPKVLDLDGRQGDPVSQEIARTVVNLPAGIYRTHVSICLIEFDSKGLEKSSRVVSGYAFDFESKPKELPAAEPAPAAKDETDGT